jgi:hypothetical protein
MKTLMLLSLSLLSISLIAQNNLIQVESWKNKVQAALDVVRINEPDLFSEIISKSTIQAGDLKEAGYAGFCDVQETPSGKILWIMIALDELKNSSKKSIASLIVHEALHIKNRLHDLPGRNWGNFSYQEKIGEHTLIYNYELNFIKKIKASTDEIEGLKRLMQNEKIPIF